MKKNRLFFVIIFLILLSSLLSACAGGGAAAVSWPGLTVDGETGYLAFNQHIFAINLANGTEIWRFPREADNQISFYAAPALTDGQLLAGSYTNHTLYSLNPADGTLNWEYTDDRNRFIAGPLIIDQSIYAASVEGALLAVDLNGNQLWPPFETEHSLWATPATDGELVFLPSIDHHVYALNARNGQEVWRTEDLRGSVLGTPTIGPDGILYVGTFGREVLALDPSSGQILNRFATEGWVWAAPALEGDRLYFGDLDGFVYAVSLADFSEVWKVQPDTLPKQAISDSPLVVEDTVYVASKSGNLHALLTENGTPRWSRTIGGRLHATPVIASDSILVAPMNIDALLVAMDANGNQTWAFTPQ